MMLDLAFVILLLGFLFLCLGLGKFLDQVTQ
jgi:hypothetical protein